MTAHRLDEDALAKMAAAASPSDAAGHFFEALARYLQGSPRERRQLWRLSLTVPAWEPCQQTLRAKAHTLADQIAAHAGAGAWLALDYTNDGRGHIYGIAISEQPREWFSTLWSLHTGASFKGCDVKPVTGQKYGWGGEARALAKLLINLSASVRYGLKSLPVRYDLPLNERVLATGCLRIPWEQACALLEKLTGATLGEPQHDGVLARCCQRCRKPLPPKKRRHARWCSPSCRTLAGKERNSLRAHLSAEELDAFEERAAVLEFDGGLLRPRAEQCAYDEIRKAGSAAASARPAELIQEDR